MITSDTILHEPPRQPKRRRRSLLAVLAAASGLGLIGTGAVLAVPAAASATTRPLLRGKVASLGTDSFTVTSGAATVTVDVSTTTTYADVAVSGASFTTLSVGSRVAVEGTLAGTNLVDASTVRILPSTPIGRRPVFRLGLGEARLGAGLGRVRGAVAFVPLSCRGGSCRGTLRLSVTEFVGRHDELVPAGAATYTMAAGSDHLVAVRLAPRALSELVRARGRRLVATATILGAGRHSVVERLELFA